MLSKAGRWADKVVDRLLGNRVARLFNAQSAPSRYLLVAALMALALALRLAMAPVQAGLQYVTFFPAVTLSAFMGGLRAGMVATAIGLALATFIFTPPYYSVSWAVVQASAWSNLVFLADGFIVSLVIDAMHRYRRRYQTELQESRQAAERQARLNQELGELLRQQAQSEEQLRVAAVAFEANEAIMITDASSRILRVNQAFERLTGYRAAEVLGQNPRMLASGRHDRVFYTAMWRALLDTGTWTGEIWDRHKTGHVYPKQMTITAVRNEAGRPTGYVSIFSDITERKRAEEAIRNLAFYDPLTGLPNRRLLADRLGTALVMAARERQWGAVLCLDMDRFKQLNDTLGHHHGDLLLTEIASRLRTLVRESDTVARLGGDEFVVLASSVSADPEEASLKAAHLADKVRDALAAPYHLDGYAHQSSASIGVCLFGGTEFTADELLQRADKAMYGAKEAGRNRVRFFDPQLQQTVRSHARMEAELGEAIAQRQFRLHYQLQVDAQGRPQAAQAVLRWQHPSRGLLPPEQFWHVARGTAMLPPLTDWMLDEACRQLAAWQGQEHTRHLALGLPVRDRHLAQPGLAQRLEAMLQTHGAPAERLHLNLSEASLLGDLEHGAQGMHELRERLGVRLLLDQFGAGPSSLTTLQRLPLDQVRLDAGLVRGVLDDPASAALVSALVDVARRFKLQVLADGVDNAQQWRLLADLGCVAFQGSLFGPPTAIESFNALLVEGPAPA